MQEQIPVFLECQKCGAKITWASDTADDEIMACGKCGNKIGRYGDVKNAAAKAVRTQVIDDMKTAIKKSLKK